MKSSVSLAMQQNSVFAPFSPADFLTGLDWAKAIGVDAVELIILDPNQVDVNSLTKSLDARGLAVSTIATGQMVSEKLTFCDESEDIRNAAVKRICCHIDLSTKIGNPNVTIGLARGKGSDDHSILKKQFSLVQECVKRCGDYATQKGIIINLEPLNRYESNMLHSSADTFEFYKKTGFDSIGILYDTFHSNIEDADMLETISEYSPHFSHVHFADSNRRVPGQGHIDFKAIVKLLKEKEYTGYISLEVLNNPNAENVIENARGFVSIVRS